GWAFRRHIDLTGKSMPATRIFLQRSDGRELDLELQPGSEFVSRHYKSRWPGYDEAAFIATGKTSTIAGFLQPDAEAVVRISLGNGDDQTIITVTDVARNGSGGSETRQVQLAKSQLLEW